MTVELVLIGLEEAKISRLEIEVRILITNASTRFATLGVVSLPLVSVIKAVKFS